MERSLGTAPAAIHFPRNFSREAGNFARPSFPARQPPAKLGPFQTRREVWLDMAESTSSILIHN